MIALSKTFEKGEPGQMSMKLKDLREEIDLAIAGVSSIKDFKGDTELRDALLALLKFYKSISADQYKEMIRIIGQKSGTTQADVEKLQQMQNEISQQENGLDKRLAEAQKEFSRKHNIRVKKNELQEKIDKL